VEVRESSPQPLTNVEVVKGAYAALNRGDVDAALDAFHPDAVHDWSRSIGPYQGVYRSREEARAFWSEFVRVLDELFFEVEETIEAGPHVVAMTRVRIRGHGSGVEVEARGPHLWTLQDGRAIRFCLFQEKHEALAALRGEE
jgi:ketosteroid isomerase-like protein